MLAPAIALTLLFAPPTGDSPAPPDGVDAPAEPPAAEPPAAEPEPEPEPEPPKLRAPGSLRLAPHEPGDYQLLDREGQPASEVLHFTASEQIEVELPAGIYFVHGPTSVTPVALEPGAAMIWDGDELIPVEVWDARRAQEEAAAAAGAADLDPGQDPGQGDQSLSPPAPRAEANWRVWGSPLASVLVPGVGQFFNGQGGKGTGLLFGTIGSIAGAAALYNLGNDGTRAPGAEYARLVGFGVFSTAAPVLWVYAIADAYRVAVDKDVTPALDHKVRLSATRMMTLGFRADAQRPGFFDDWSVSIMGQATRRFSLGLSDLSVKPGGRVGPQVWQFGFRLDYRVFDRKRVWLDLALGSILQVAVGEQARALDPEAVAPPTVTRFGAAPYGQLDVRVFVLDRLSIDFVPRLTIPLTTRYYSVQRALPRYAPELEFGAGISTYF